MDIPRHKTNIPRRAQAVDGFFTKPVQQATRVTTTRGVQSSQPTASLNGRVNDFKRADGFHGSQRRTMIGAASSVQSGSLKPAGKAVLHTQFPVVTIPGDTTKHHRGSRRNTATAGKLTKFRNFRKWAFRTTAFAVVLGLIGGGLLFGKGYFQLKKVFNGNTSAAALNANVDPIKLKGEGDGRINILLLGIGGGTHDGGDLTDTIMIASVDPVNNQAVLLSIPRDLWTKMPNNYISNYQKLNAAYVSGKYKYLGKQDASNANNNAVQAGFQGIDGVVERVAGIPIHYNMLIDFTAFRQAVDTVGGVTITTKVPLIDPTIAWENDRNPIIAKLGVNEFDGRHALNFVRSRATSSDFARSERQREVILALKDKVLNLGTLSNPAKLSSLMSAFGDNVKTDISLSDSAQMAAIMKKIPNNQIQSVGLVDGENNFLTTGTINGLSIVQPRAGLEDYTAIQSYIRSKLKDGYIAQENASISVLNGSVVPGLATEIADQLKPYGYNIDTVDNAPTADYPQTEIYDLSGGTKKYTVNYLKNRYNVSTVKKVLPTGIVQGKASIVIILSQNAATTN